MKSLYTKANELLNRLEFSKKTKLLIGIIALGIYRIFYAGLHLCYQV